MPVKTLIPWESLDEEELLVRAREGSKDAVQELIGRHEPLVRWFLKRRLQGPCARVVDVDDLVQELRLDFAKRRVRATALQTPAAFLNYLLKSAWNKAGEVQRHWLKRKKRNLALERGELAGAIVDGHVPEWLHQELVEEAVELGFRCPGLVSQVYFMLMQKGTPKQIAKILRISLPKVYRAMSVAERRLRSALCETRGPAAERRAASP